jgi:general stress protein 26
MENDQVQRIRELLEDFDTAMLVTHRGDFAHARPMAIAAVESHCNVWFFTGRGTPKVHEIHDDDTVLVVCQDEHERYISLSGRAEIVAEREKVRQLWSERYKTWFPGGVEDPELLLICVHAEEAEYWDQHGAKALNYFFQAAKARALKARPGLQEGEQHGKVIL